MLGVPSHLHARVLPKLISIVGVVHLGLAEPFSCPVVLSHDTRRQLYLRNGSQIDLDGRQNTRQRDVLILGDARRQTLPLGPGRSCP